MKIGVMIEAQEQMTWDVWRAVARAVDDLGFESLWRSDHIRTLAGGPHREVLEAWTALTFLATATRRIRFGAMVSPMTFRHPSMLALQAAAVDALSGGRLELGVGAGWNGEEHQVFGIDLPPMKERMDRFEEGTALIKALLSQRPASFQGRYYSLNGAILSPPPVQDPHMPIMIGGKGEQRVLRVVARYANAWNAGGLTPEQYRAKSAVLDERCREIGRDPREVERSMMATCVIGQDDVELREHAAAVEAIFPLWGGGAAANPRGMRDVGWVVGTAEEIVEQLRRYDAAGVQRVMLQHLTHDRQRPLQLFADKVLPAFAS